MTNKPEKEHAVAQSDFCFSLPTIVRSKSGILFDPSRLIWAYRDGVNSVYMDFSGLHFTPMLIASIRLTLIWFAENGAL